MIQDAFHEREGHIAIFTLGLRSGWIVVFHPRVWNTSKPSILCTWTSTTVGEAVRKRKFSYFPIKFHNSSVRGCFSGEGTRDHFSNAFRGKAELPYLDLDPSQWNEGINASWNLQAYPSFLAFSIFSYAVAPRLVGGELSFCPPSFLFTPSYWGKLQSIYARENDGGLPVFRLCASH